MEAKSMSTPGAREDSDNALSDDNEINNEEATKYRKLAARLNYLAANGPISKLLRRKTADTWLHATQAATSNG